MSLLGRNWRVIAVILGLVAAGWILYLLRMALLPFLAGLVLAYLLQPAVGFLERRLPWAGRQSLKRTAAIMLVFLVLLGVAGFFSYYLVTTVLHVFQSLVEQSSNIIGRSVFNMQQSLQALTAQLPPGVRESVNQSVLDASAALGNQLKAILTKQIVALPQTFNVVFSFAALPLFLFYILLDGERLKKGLYSALPPRAAEHARSVGLILERVLGRWLRAQMLLGFVVGYLAFVGLLILRSGFAPVLAVVAGVTELIPTLGPWIGGIVAVLLTMATTPEKTIWVVIVFLAIQMMENTLLVPRIQGAYLRLHPAVTVVLLVVGAYVAGIWGMLLAAPLAATAIELYRYVRSCYSPPPVKTGGELDAN